MEPRQLTHVLGEAGAAGVLTTEWTGGWGTSYVHMAMTPAVPVLNVACEDYGLLARLAERGQGPAIRVDARAEYTGEAQAANTVAMVRGRRLPDEYVVLSAHFDSWDAASGATDNASGAVVMMEAHAHPPPRLSRSRGGRSSSGLWSGEEQGLNGSRAFAEDHPEVVAGLQALLNQDTGTGRIERISLQGFSEAEPFWRRWLGRLPPELTEGVELDAPGHAQRGIQRPLVVRLPRRAGVLAAVAGRGTTAPTPGTPTATRTTSWSFPTCAGTRSCSPCWRTWPRKTRGACRARCARTCPRRRHPGSRDAGPPAEPPPRGTIGG